MNRGRSGDGVVGGVIGRQVEGLSRVGITVDQSLDRNRHGVGGTTAAGEGVSGETGRGLVIGATRSITTTRREGDRARGTGTGVGHRERRLTALERLGVRDGEVGDGGGLGRRGNHDRRQEGEAPGDGHRHSGPQPFGYAALGRDEAAQSRVGWWKAHFLPISFGGWATSVGRPLALRPRLTTGLPVQAPHLRAVRLPA
jgi:hypothetical protein